MSGGFLSNGPDAPTVCRRCGMHDELHSGIQMEHCPVPESRSGPDARICPPLPNAPAHPGVWLRTDGRAIVVALELGAPGQWTEIIRVHAEVVGSVSYIVEPSKPQAHLGTVKPLAQIEFEAIRGALNLTNGNKSKTARLLGVDRRTLYRKIAAYKRDGLLP